MILRLGIKYGLMCGLFLTAALMVTYFFGQNPFDPALWIVDLLIFGLFIFFADYEFKNFKNGGILHFWQGMSLGFMVFIPAALVCGLLLWIWLSYDQGLTDYHRKMTLEIYRENQDLLGQVLTEAEALDRSPGQIAAQMALQNKMLTGFFMTPILAIVLRRKPS